MGKSQNTKVDPDPDPGPKWLNERSLSLDHQYVHHARKFQSNRPGSLRGVVRQSFLWKKNNSDEKTNCTKTIRTPFGKGAS